MDLEAELIRHGGVLVAGFALAGITLTLALWHAPWPALARDHRDHAYFGCIAALLVLWHLSAGAGSGPNLHLVGATLLTLMFGPALALIAITVLVAVNAFLGAGSYAAIGINVTLCGLAPIAVTVLVERAARRHLPANPFVLILLCGFAGGALSVLVIGALSAGLLLLGTDLGRHAVIDEYLVFYLLLPYGEGFLTGGALAWGTMFYPHWVAAYREPTNRPRC